MQLYTLDPLSDSRWDDLVASHPAASVFHQTGWLKALAITYGYRAVALTSAPPGERLSDGLVFCEIKSWLTGNRLVSLPFSDHAEPLLKENRESFAWAEWMEAERRRRDWSYIELRPLSCETSIGESMVQSQSFWLHTLDLTVPLEQLFAKLHKSCIQRRIRHAEREQLSYQKSSADELIDEFYALLMITRRRFGLLPQPRAWFQNLLACLSPSARIRMIRKDGRAIAAILTLHHRGTVVYKYGCSDEAFHHLGGMPFLFWKLIEESKTDGAEEIDFGRTDLDNEGLIRFKDCLGAVRRKLNYFRYPQTVKKNAIAANLRAIRGLFSILPDALSSRLGRMAYRHIG
jgi:lipid II:glycine glycyltransferase (peptidoglycan interpeptide bridge formation enzyme)